MKITVVTPSVREEALGIVKKCLHKQTLSKEDWEWIVVSPFDYTQADLCVADPPKREGDFYSLNKAYNAGIKAAHGNLIISWQDGIWSNPETLEHLWNIYLEKPDVCVGGVGNQYNNIDIFGKPIVSCWTDPRKTSKYGEFYEINPIDLEFTLCSLPRQALYACGGFEEEFDKGAAVGEKELCLRMDKAGYKFYLDQGLEYRALHHSRLTGDWDTYYDIACTLFDGYKSEIINGARLKLSYLEEGGES